MLDSDRRRQMAALVRGWRTSGETQAAFASRHGITRAKFGYWQRQLRSTRGVPEDAGFAAVHVVPTPGVIAPGVVDVVLASGDRLVIRAGASLPVVRVVLSAFRKTSC
jgi:hypothetical protein